MYLRNLLLGIVFLCTLSFVQAQSYSGFLTDNYNGVHGILSNPANIADSRLKLDINLVGASAFFGNDYIGFKLKDAFADYSAVFDEARTFPFPNNSMALNVDVLGPSVMFNINKKSSLAIFTRGRAFLNVNDVDGSLLEKEGGFNETEDFNISEGVISGATNVWGEIGLTYARVLLDNNEHFIKGGLSLKYLQSAGHAYFYSTNVGLFYTAATRNIETTGELLFANSSTSDDGGNFEINNGSGIGADLGFVYEWRPDYSSYTKIDKNGNTIADAGKNKYKLKLGISITDIGKIKNSTGREFTYNLNTNQSIDNFDGANLEEGLENNFEVTREINSQNSILPKALHTNADWNINSKFYLNLNADLPLNTTNTVNANNILSEVSLTPRYETTWLSIYSPFRIVQYAGLQWGAGLRMGPLYLGSGSIVSVLFGDTSKTFDLYAGVNIPFYQSKLRDKDNDGIEDVSDDCPETPGPIENNGCPWEDTDGDGTLDKDDDCPQVAGPKENKGCPWPDSDNDGIFDKDDDCPTEPGLEKFNGCPDTDGDGLMDKDDRCPNHPGEIENKGCPDTDGDTLVDIDDQCPNIPGPLSNNGCPEVTQEVQKQLNDYAKTILFDTGKATIKPESVSAMVDIIQILNEYQNAKFTVEGHTDSVGSASSNQRLSEARANSVRGFLINEGIAPDRLSAIGFGEEKPIASNTTRIGRKQNRRVEINLIK